MKTLFKNSAMLILFGLFCSCTTANYTIEKPLIEGTEAKKQSSSKKGLTIEQRQARHRQLFVGNR